MKLAYRDYQIQATDAALAHAAPGGDGALIASATGTGKTVMATRLALMTEKPTLMTVNRVELVNQTISKFELMGFRVFVEQGDSRAHEHVGEILDAAENGPTMVVGSIQSLYDQRLGKWPRDLFGRIIVDECHHGVAPSWRRVFEYFSAPVVGFSATVRRPGLGNLFTPVFRMSLHEAEQQGWVVRMRWIVERIANWDMSKLRRPRFHIWRCAAGHEHKLAEKDGMSCPTCSGEIEMFAPADITAAEFASILEEEGAERIVPAIKQGIIQHLGTDRKGLLFTPSVPIARRVVDWMTTNTDVASEVVHHKTPSAHCAPRCLKCGFVMEMGRIEEMLRPSLFSQSREWGFDANALREFISAGEEHVLSCESCKVMESFQRCPCRSCLLGRFSRGDTRLVGNFGILTEGFDDPRTNLIVIMRGTANPDLYEQMAGRGARLSPGIARTIGDLSDAADRRRMIAESDKPDCLVVGLHGVDESFSLATAASLILGELPPIPSSELDSIVGQGAVTMDDIVRLASERAEELREAERIAQAEQERREGEYKEKQERARARRSRDMASVTTSQSVEVDYWGDSRPTIPADQDARPDHVRRRHEGRFPAPGGERATKEQVNRLWILHRQVPESYADGLKYARQMYPITELWGRDRAGFEIKYLEKRLAEVGRLVGFEDEP